MSAEADVERLEARLEDARRELVAAMSAQRKAQQRFYFTARALHEARATSAPFVTPEIIEEGEDA